MSKENTNTEQSEIKKAAVRKKKKSVKMKKREKAKSRKKILDSWYDNADVMQILKISESTLARRRKQEKIPYTELGGKYYYPREFFEKSMAAKMKNKHLIEKK